MNYALRYPRFWLGYFIFCVVMVIWSTVSEALADFGAVSVWSVASTVLAVFFLWALYGYTRQIRYASRWLWMVVLCVVGLQFLGALAFSLFTTLSSLNLLPLLVAATVVLLGGPGLFALHQYIFRSPHIWL